MEEIKKLLKGKKHVWFRIEECYKTQFLNYAKNNGCKWMNGDDINPEKDNIFCFMGINNKRQLGFVTAYCWALGKKIKKIDFKK